MQIELFREAELLQKIKLFQEAVVELEKPKRPAYTEGMVALRRLQNNECKIWTKEELESIRLTKDKKEILRFVRDENWSQRIPSTKDVINLDSVIVGSVYSNLRLLRNSGIIFNITIQEIVAYYGLDNLGYTKGYFHPPEHLKWLEPYLENMRGRKGSTRSWHERIESPRSTYRRHWIALVEKEDKPCYYPLGLHIQKE